MSNSGRNSEIEALRGIAIVITIAAHLRLLFFWAPSWFETFASKAALGVGVDLFFCISGFVIARTVIPALPRERSWSRFREFALPFWVRRMWRLWPSAFLWLAIYLLLTATFNTSGAFGPFENTARSSVAAALQLANVYFPICVSNQNCGVNLVYWSLSLEEQFYLLFPFVLFAFRQSWMAVLFLVLIAAQIMIPRPSASLLWSMRTEAIAFGVLLAMLSLSTAHRSIEPAILRSRWLRPPLFCALAYLLVRLPVIWPMLSPGIAAPVAAAIVWIAGYNKGYLIADGPLRAMLVYIGSRSYALYLCHEAVFRGTRELWHRIEPAAQFDGTYTLRFSVTAVALTFLLAEFNYRLIETPLRERGKTIARQIEARLCARRAGSDHGAPRPIQSDVGSGTTT